ncbi:hypothetical protein GW17_00044082 [Ensete ventricosum]|nr:hypothetical protein GW17_00044082 [Ensete ventricosum]RZS25993.1 hypothetical protein BHM03_00059278 [Ensete ventricosum]
MFSLFVYCEKEHMLIACRSIVVQRYHHLLGTNLQRDHRSVMLWNLRMQEISLPARENDDMVLHSWKQRIPCKGKKISRVEGRSTVVLAKAEGFGRFGSVASNALRASSMVQQAVMMLRALHQDISRPGNNWSSITGIRH